ncbi:hypothetical protein ACQ4LE_005670 [Meloidogyne hapla]
MKAANSQSCSLVHPSSKDKDYAAYSLYGIILTITLSMPFPKSEELDLVSLFENAFDNYPPNKCETCKKLATKMLYIWRLTDILVHPSSKMAAQVTIISSSQNLKMRRFVHPFFNDMDTPQSTYI